MQTILGAVLVAASIWMPGIGIASNMMFAAGSAMAVGGVMQMIPPQVQGLASKPIIKPSVWRCHQHPPKAVPFLR
jgi:predicted phage tail protein